MTLMRPFLLLLVLGAGCSTTVRGVVRDKPTGNPLSSATVAIGERSGTTNAFGAYEVRARVKPASLLIINAPGYFMYSASVGKKSDAVCELVGDVELTPRTEITARK
jgi:hypothetical protein